jgi:hypothetical protein
LHKGDVAADVPLKRPNGELRKFIEEHIFYSGDDCLIMPFCRSPQGYPKVWFAGHRIQAARLMCMLRWGEPEDPTMDTAHSCGNGYAGCVNPMHLRWATRKENLADMRAHGTVRVGEKNWSSKLTAIQAAEIRRLGALVDGIELAKKFNVSPSTISSILNRKSWKHI